MSDEIDSNIDSQVESMMKTLETDPIEGAEEGLDDGTAIESGAEELTDDIKPNDEETVEPETALEPPTSWRSDEKELFKSMPREAQEVALRLQQAADSHFTQRSTELATKIRATDDERQQYQADRARYASELTNLNKLANQLLPAKFADIQSEADYLRLKSTDPARASEYEAFQQILQGSMKQADQLRQSQLNEHLAKEWSHFVSKNPDFQDGAKATAMMSGVRQGAVEYYGYSPEEVKVIVDHRQIEVMRDALAWRQHNAALKSAQMKRVTPVQRKVLTSSASSNSSPNSDSKSALLNRARNSSKEHEKAELIARYLNAG